MEILVMVILFMLIGMLPTMLSKEEYDITTWQWWATVLSLIILIHSYAYLTCHV